jgi:hypothetical protein
MGVQEMSGTDVVADGGIQAPTVNLEQSFNASAAPPTPVPEVGRVLSVSGDVRLEREGTTRQLQAGEAIRATDIVRSGNGKAGFQLNDTSRVILGSNSSFNFNKLNLSGPQTGQGLASIDGSIPSSLPRNTPPSPPRTTITGRRG